jgi:hypothetical protein
VGAQLPSDQLAAPKLRWWKETLIVGVFYGVYTLVRNQFGSARIDGPATVPFRHALAVIRLESRLGLYGEHAVQRAFVSIRWFLQFWNVWYGTAHFIVTVIAFVALFRRTPHRFARWRNALAFTTALALIGFSFYPLMPPRLLSDPGIYGGAELAKQVQQLPGRIDFIDTLKVAGGPWSFDSGAMTKVSNQFAAMPSLHCAWALWSSLALWPLVRRRYAKALVALYPFATLFCIVVTANHYWLDAAAGVITLGVGWLLGNTFENLNQRRLARQRATSPHVVLPDVVATEIDNEVGIAAGVEEADLVAGTDLRDH